MKIRDFSEKDYKSILDLNNSNLPAVSELNFESLSHLHKQSIYSWVIEDQESCDLAGFCLILPQDVEYSSDNYIWLSQRYSQFQYLDRVVIAESFQGQGYGRKIYEHWFKEAETLPLLLEINIRPMNKGSLIFHQKMGFQAIGEQDTEGGKKRVQYMVHEKRM